MWRKRYITIFNDERKMLKKMLSIAYSKTRILLLYIYIWHCTSLYTSKTR